MSTSLHQSILGGKHETLSPEAICQLQKDYAPVLRKSTYKERIERIDRISNYLKDSTNHDALIEALHKDLRKNEVESLLSEHGVVLSHIRYIRKNLKSWMKPKSLPVRLMQTGFKNYIHYESKGSALIIAPWNYPFNLAIAPLAYAIAAGCTVTLKPSESTPNVSEFIRQMIAKLFTPQEVAVVLGDGKVGAELTAQPYDHMYFTGSPAVGKKIMEAASKQLASVTLELGGKSPVVVSSDVNIKKSAANTVWGKFFNAGQTCVAPDYMLVDRKIGDEYIQELVGAIEKAYGADPSTSDSLARMVSEKHFDNVKSILDDAIEKGAKIIRGGQTNRSDLYIAPTILTGVTSEMKIAKEEIFGPILPILYYDTLEDAIKIIESKPKPLAFYIQGGNKSFIQKLLRNSTAGGTMINDYLLIAGQANVPFGGVNNSGIGKSFGFHGFVEFSNERSVMHRRFLDLSLVYPPYTNKVVSLVRRIYTWL